jgi:hypothetical protein
VPNLAANLFASAVVDVAGKKRLADPAERITTTKLGGPSLAMFARIGFKRAVRDDDTNFFSAGVNTSPW